MVSPEQQVQQLLDEIAQLEAQRKVMASMGELKPEPCIQLYFPHEAERNNGRQLLDQMLELRIKALALMKLCAISV
jgi:hypothetical protein